MKDRAAGCSLGSSLGREANVMCAPAYVDRLHALIRGCVPRPSGTHFRDLTLIIALILLALFVRVYRLELLGWVPDTYDRVVDARGVSEGRFPQSRLYLPGMSLLLAPLAAVFPNSLSAVQALVIVSGASMVPVGYISALNVTHDRRTALLFGFTMAMLPAYVHFSRDGLFDMINTLLIVISVLVVPQITRQNLFLCALYALLLAVIVNIRATNVFLLPVLILYHAAVIGVVRHPRRVLSSLTSPQCITIAIILMLAGALSVILGNWTTNAAGVPVTLRTFIHNFATYQSKLVYGSVGSFCVVPLAFAGARRLHRLNSPLLIAGLAIIIVWPLAHAPLSFASARYMLPPLFFVFLLVTLGPAEVLSFASKIGNKWRPPVLAYLVLAVGLLGFIFLVGTGLIIGNWHNRAAESDEGLFREFRPVVRNLGQRSLVISAVSRGFTGSEGGIEFVDLIDLWLDHGRRPDGLPGLISLVEDYLAEGRQAYYLYSRFESGIDFQGGGRDHYDDYFEAINDKYQLTPVFRSSAKSLGEENWILYRIDLHTQLTPQHDDPHSSP